MLEMALAHAPGTHTVEDVIDRIVSGDAQCWPLEDGSIIVTEIVCYSQCKHLNVWLAAGRRDVLYDMHPAVVEFARKHGCSHLTLTGRRGWMKAGLDKHGWSLSSITMSKPI